MPPVIRSASWVGFAPAGVVALGMAWVASRQPSDTMARLLPTRLAVLAIAIGVAFVFDDAAAVLSDPAPSPLILRRLIRSLSAVLVASVLAVVVLFVASAQMDLVWVIPLEAAPIEEVALETSDHIELEPSTPFPGGRLGLEAATLIALTLATAAAVSRRGDPQPGRVTTSVLLGVYAVSWMIPESHKPWADPSDQRWETGAAWWWLALGVSVLAGISLSWDTRKGSWRHTIRTRKRSAIAESHGSF
ncbi:MAG: hypothetical protein WD274_07730 [Acidimicrobiia bacterium]